MLPRLFLLSFILFCLELGLYLTVLPWTFGWERNFFLLRYPALEPWVLNHYVRGAISGLGLADLGLGCWYAAHYREHLERLLESRVPAPPGVPKTVQRGQTA